MAINIRNDEPIDNEEACFEFDKEMFIESTKIQMSIGYQFGIVQKQAYQAKCLGQDCRRI